MSITSFDTVSSKMDCRIWLPAIIGSLTGKETRSNEDYVGVLKLAEKTYTYQSIHHVTNFSMRSASPVGYAFRAGEQTLAAIQTLYPERLLSQGELSRDDLHAAIVLGSAQFYRETMTEGIAGFGP